MDQDQPSGHSLAEWSYSRDEWRQFSRWLHKRNGWLSYWLYLLGRKTGPRPMKIVLKPGEVRIEAGGICQVFQPTQLSRVHILDKGLFNVMELVVSTRAETGAAAGELFLLVPKGKLREAIWVEETLLKAWQSNR